MYKLKFNSKDRQYSFTLKNKEEVIYILNTTHLASKISLWEQGRLLSQGELTNLINRISKQAIQTNKVTA